MATLGQAGLATLGRAAACTPVQAAGATRGRVAEPTPVRVAALIRAQAEAHIPGQAAAGTRAPEAAPTRALVGAPTLVLAGVLTQAPAGDATAVQARENPTSGTDPTRIAGRTMRSLLIWAPCLVSVIVVSMATVTAHAHPGGLDAQGCHHDRKRGGYHCHGGRAAPTRSFVEVSSAGPPSSRSLLGGAYRNCAAARAAGAAPVRMGDPGYGPHLDRDGDGVGCEPYRGR